MSLTQFKRQLQRDLSKRRLARYKRYLPLPIALISLSLVTVVGTSQANHRADQQAAKTVASQDSALVKIKQQQQARVAQPSGSASTNSAVTGAAPQPQATTTPAADGAKPSKSTTATNGAAALSGSVATTQASFSKQITRNNQYAPGTMIYNLPAKGEKGYYGGDLIINKSSVTMNRYGVGDRTIVITTPGGVIMNPPNVNWDDRGPVGIGAVDMPYPVRGNSFTMSVIVNSSTITPGNYTLHLHASRDNENGDAMYYDYFLPVTITE